MPLNIVIKDTAAGNTLRVPSLAPEQRRALRISTVLPGGAERCSFIVHEPLFLVPEYLGLFYEVHILDEQGEVWQGRMQDFRARRGAQGDYWEVTAYGFGVNLSDQHITAQNVRNTQSSAVVSAVVTSNTQQIAATSISATAFTFSNTADVNLKLLSVAEIVDMMKQFGDSAFNEQIWYVYPNDAGTVTLTFKDRPTTPDVFAQVREFENVDFGLLGRMVVNRVIVQYADGASTVTRNDTTLQGAGPAGFGFIKDMVVVVPEITNSADANQIGDAVLTAYKTVRMAANNMSGKSNVGFLDAYRSDLAPWRVRAGMLLQFEDINPADGAVGNISWSNVCLIAGTQWDEDGQTFTLTAAENWDLVAERELARARRLLAGRHTTAGA